MVYTKLFAAVVATGGVSLALPGRSPLIAPKEGYPVVQDQIIVKVDSVDAMAKVAADLGATVVSTLPDLKAIVLQVPRTNWDSVRDHNLVQYVEVDAMNFPTKTLINGTDTKLWGLDRLDKRELSLDGEFTIPGNGEGVDVYVLDTGVQISHEQFENRAFDFWTGYTQVVGGKLVPMYRDTAGSSHATHCAGTIAGKDFGVAPKARIGNVRVLGPAGGSNSIVSAGMMFVLNNRDKSRKAVVSMSLGGLKDSLMLGEAVTKLVNDGVLVVVAAGNDNVDACAHSPAYAADAITVGATDRDDKIATFSNWGTCVDIFAPGVSIFRACPHVAGAAAALWSQFPVAYVQDVRKILLESATPNAIKNIRPCPASPNKLLYANWRNTIYSPTDSTASANSTYKCDPTDLKSREFCMFKVGQCVSTRPGVTDKWCQQQGCSVAYKDVCTRD